eukprot:scpid106156/ scgid16903/ 
MNNNYVVPLAYGDGICSKSAAADGIPKIIVLVELLYSPYETVDWKCSCDPTVPVSISGRGFPRANGTNLSVELTFISSTTQTYMYVPFNETIKRALHGLDLDPLQRCRSLSVVANRCPVKCLPIVAKETFQWMKTFRRNDEGDVKLDSYRSTLSASWLTLRKLRPSQLYQASILNCMRRA